MAYPLPQNRRLDPPLWEMLREASSHLGERTLWGKCLWIKAVLGSHVGPGEFTAHVGQFQWGLVDVHRG